MTHQTLLGIGTDLTSIDRFHRNLEEHGERFVSKILSESEKRLFIASKQQAQFIASRFAAKEALAKALGTGFRDGLIMPDISVLSNELGRPYVELQGRAKEIADKLGVSAIHLSLSHEKELALAFVVIN
jgi:holo-[acyl-carrier protein] synthase